MIKLNYFLISITIILVGLTCLFTLFFTLYVLNTFFLFIGIASSLGLYFDALLKHTQWKTYVLLFGVLGIAFLISTFCNVCNFTISYYLLLMLFLWTIGCIHFICAILVDTKNRVILINAFCLYVSLPLFILLSQHFLILNAQPLVKDEFLMAMDGTLGFYPSLIIGRLLHSLPNYINNAIELSYQLLPFAFILLYIKTRNLEKRIPFDFIIEFLLIGILGFSLYNIIPACGSRFAFSSTWPYSLPIQFLQERPQLIYCPTDFPRNCLPSLHTAWIICLLRCSLRCDLMTRRLMIGFAIINFIAMFDTGAHYFIDIVVGFAFANCVGGLTYVQLPWNNPDRLKAIILGGLLCICWYFIILYGLSWMQSSKILAWCVFSASILLSIKLEQNLETARKMLLCKGKSH